MIFPKHSIKFQSSAKFPFRVENVRRSKSIVNATFNRKQYFVALWNKSTESNGSFFVCVNCMRKHADTRAPKLIDSDIAVCRY